MFFHFVKGGSKNFAKKGKKRGAVAFGVYISVYKKVCSVRCRGGYDPPARGCDPLLHLHALLFYFVIFFSQSEKQAGEGFGAKGNQGGEVGVGVADGAVAKNGNGDKE